MCPWKFSKFITLSVQQVDRWWDWRLASWERCPCIYNGTMQLLKQSDNLSQSSASKAKFLRKSQSDLLVSRYNQNFKIRSSTLEKIRRSSDYNFWIILSSELDILLDNGFRQIKKLVCLDILFLESKRGRLLRASSEWVKFGFSWRLINLKTYNKQNIHF